MRERLTDHIIFNYSRIKREKTVFSDGPLEKGDPCLTIMIENNADKMDSFDIKCENIDEFINHNDEVDLEIVCSLCGDSSEKGFRVGSDYYWFKFCKDCNDQLKEEAIVARKFISENPELIVSQNILND